MRVTIATIVVCGLTLPGCSSVEDDNSANSAPSPFASGIAKDRTINSLSPAEAKQFCDDTQKWAAGSPFQAKGTDLKCRIEGALAVASPPTSASAGAAAPVPVGSEPVICKAAYDACKQKEAEGKGVATTLTNNCQVTADCTATVAEVEACFDSVQAQLDSLDKSAPSCDGMTSKIASDSLLSLVTFYAQMSSGDCAPVTTKCASMNPLASLSASSAPR